MLLELEYRRGHLRRSLQEALRAAIQDGRLHAGTVLPASRRLAADLGVSRGVVSDAYDQLVSENPSPKRGLLLGYGRLPETHIDPAVEALSTVMHDLGTIPPHR